MKRMRPILASFVVLLVLAACSDDPVGTPETGALVLHLTGPNADDGAVVFEITGPPIDSVTPINGSLRLFTRRADGVMAGAVIGTVANGPIVKLWVPDISAAAAYRARVIDVADRSNSLRTSLESYALTVTP